MDSEQRSTGNQQAKIVLADNKNENLNEKEAIASLNVSNVDEYSQAGAKQTNIQEASNNIRDHHFRLANQRGWPPDVIQKRMKDRKSQIIG